MKRKQKKAAAILAAIMLAHGTAYAGSIPEISVTRTQERISSSVDNSQLPVEVSKWTGDAKTTIFTGKLGDYDNGRWVNIDFSGINVAMIFEWGETLSGPIYIIPTGNAQTQEASTEPRKNMNSIINTSGGLSISSHIKINGVNVGENGLRIIDNAQMNCLFGVENSTENDRTVSVILATYTSDRKLNAVKRAEISAIAGQNGNARIIYNFDAENEHSAKLMFWDSGMLPVRAAVDFDSASGINAYYYDSGNRLIQIDKSNGKSVFYSYDNMGNLLSKSIGGAQ